MIRERTGRPVLGVIPYLGDLGLHEEDGIPPERLWWSNNGAHRGPKLKIAVVRLRYISNFTDFDPFLYEQDVDLIYSLRESDIEHADLVIIPGSKNTVQDLLFMREAGIEASIKRAAAKGIPIIGVCGGYQMLGTKIHDPHGVESPRTVIDGMGLLDVETTFDEVKTTCQIEAKAVQSSEFIVQSEEDEGPLKGYEIHMGRTTGDIGLFHIKRRIQNSELRTQNSDLVLDGSRKGNAWGTYIHGIFDNDVFRRGLLNSLRIARGAAAVADVTSFAEARDKALDRWSLVLRENLDMEFIRRMIQ
jgi:adenosylcobyric acid synthase